MRIERAKRLAAVCTGLLLLGASALPAHAESATVAEKTYTLIVEGDSGTILPDPDAPAFWESPALTAGQTQTGTLHFANEDKSTVDMWLDAVELPYDDAQALAYLSALRLRLTRDGEVLYDGPYSRIMDGHDTGVAAGKVARGGICTYEVTLSCSFAYTGEVVPVYLDWDFKAVPAAVEETLPAPEQSTWVLVVLCAAGVLVVICAVAGAFGRARRS